MGRGATDPERKEQKYIKTLKGASHIPSQFEVEQHREGIAKR